jgi:hypothetical protein
MKPVKNRFHLDFPVNLQEEFARVVARAKSLWGRMGESTPQVEGLFDALLAQTMDNGR